MTSLAASPKTFAPVASGRQLSPWAITAAAAIQILLVLALQHLPAAGRRAPRLFRVIPIDLLFDKTPPVGARPALAVQPEQAPPQAVPSPAAQAPGPAQLDPLEEIQIPTRPIIPPRALPVAPAPASSAPGAARVEQLRSAFRRRFCVLLESEKSAGNTNCPEPFRDLSGTRRDARYELERDLGGVLGPDFAGLSLREAGALKGFHLKGQPLLDRDGDPMALPDPKLPDLSAPWTLADQMLGPLPLPSHVPKAPKFE